MADCNCNSNNPVTHVYYPSGCSTGPSQAITDSSNIMYTGANLTAIGVTSNSNLEVVLSNINTAVGAITGIDWASFNYACLPTPITSAQDFSETISTYLCNLNTSYTTFTGTTYVNKIAEIEQDITDINNPELTSCVAVGIISSDNLIGVLTKLMNNLCSLNTEQDPSSANWNEYFSTDPVPTTITEGFNVVLDQIGNLMNTVDGYEPLPTFDNTNTCLATPTTTDSLYDTILKIRTLLCTLPDFDINSISWTSCIANPNPGGGADLISTIQTLVTYLDTTYVNRVTYWDPTYFDVTNTSPSDSCSGQSITLQSGLGFEDKMVALNGSDTSPNYLLNKMINGTGINFDTATSPGTVIISTTVQDVKVKANAGDTVAGYLIDKIDGKTDPTAAIAINESYNATTDMVDLTPSINYGNLAAQWMETVFNNPTLYAQFSEMVCAAQPCPDGSPRSVSGNISVISGSAAVEFSVEFDQASPLLAFYSSGNIAASAGDVITTGAFTVTSPSIPVNGTLTINNNNTGDSLPYNIYVLDNLGDAVPGSTTQTGSIPSSGTLIIDPFTYGSVTNMIVYIELGTGLLTTSTTTTTTTIV